MKKILIIVLTILISFLGFNIIKAYEIGDPDDIFYVTSPAANQKVSGAINITWRMWDDDQSTIQYTAKLFDAASCENVNYGTINANLSGTSNKNQDNSLSWNTNNTQSSTNLPDGNYCLQICAAMKNGSSSYSACNSRIVKIVNHNSLPTITSNPSNLTIHESDSWQYQVTAYDPDNDHLTYSLVYGTNFISINSQTGLIKTNSNSKTLPTGVNQANYKIKVAVDDGISGSATQEFTLSIVKDQPTTPPPSTNPETPQTPEEPSTPEQPETNNTPTKIDILYPVYNSILKGSSNDIKWNINEPDGVAKIVLEYSKDTDKNWKTIATLSKEEELTFNSYTWDVSRISDDIYYLRITVTDKQNSEVNRVSDSFLIQNNTQETQSEPLIINLKPDSTSEINVSSPQLSGEFVPSSDSKVVTSSIKILLNDVDITKQCKVTESGFTCDISKPLEDGKHSVNVSYKDSNGKVASINWTFTINTQPQEQTLTQENVVILGREIPKNSLIILFLVCGLFLILLIVPWVLYTIWKKNKKKNEENGIQGFNGVGSQDFGQFQPVSTEPLPPLQPYSPSEPPQNLPTVSENYQAPTTEEIEQSLQNYWQGKGQPVPETPTLQPPEEVIQPQPIQPGPSSIETGTQNNNVVMGGEPKQERLEPKENNNEITPFQEVRPDNITEQQLQPRPVVDQNLNETPGETGQSNVVENQPQPLENTTEQPSLQAEATEATQSKAPIQPQQPEPQAPSSPQPFQGVKNDNGAEDAEFVEPTPTDT